MSDRELIIGLLERAERRKRANRLVQNLAESLALALVFPVGFALLNLRTPFSRVTATVFYLVWAAATAAFVIWRARGRDNLTHVAADLDRKATLQDQLKTAYWFIRNPQESPWVDEQIHRAADNSSRINVNALYPRRIPRTFYAAAGLAVVLVGLTLVPLASDRPTPADGQKAPAVALTETQKALIEQTRNLLRKARMETGSQAGLEFENQAEGAESGAISMDSLLQQSEALKEQLDEAKQNQAKIVRGLQQMASALQQSQPFKPTAQAMNQADLGDAASEIRQAADELKSAPKSEQKAAGQALDEAASKNSITELKELSKDMADAAKSLGQQNGTSAKASLEKAATELDRLAKEMDAQTAMSEASKQLQELMKALGPGDPNAKRTPQEEAEASEDPQGSNSGGVGPEDESGQAGEGNNDKGVNPTAGSGPRESGPIFGAPTKLDVQLKKEALEGNPNSKAKNTDKKDDETLEQSSKMERSKLDYRKVPSELTPAEKDLLNQDRIPWEYRELVKQYFQAIRPQEKQPTENQQK